MSRAWHKSGALLWLLFGASLGGAGGGAVGLFLGSRRAVTPPPVAARLDLGESPAQPPPAPPSLVPDGGSHDGGSSNPAAVLCVEVRDAGDRPVAAATVSARPILLPTLGLRPGDPSVGELGVFAGPLPFPAEVIAGQATPLGPSRGDLRPPASPADALRTDASGHACLRLTTSGRLQVTAVRDDRSASAELVVGSSGSPGPSLTLLLRLGESLDSVCRLLTPASLPTVADDGSGEPVSDRSGPEVSGRVVDGRGFALPAVRIEGQIGRARVLGVSDSTGSFRLSGLPLGTLALRAQLAGYAPLLQSRRPDEPRSELTLTLRPGGGISGTLHDARLGTLPAGAQLTLAPQGDSATVSVPLAEGGAFSLSGLPVGAATLRAKAPGFAPQSRTVQIPPADAPGQISLRDLRFELAPGSGLRGQLRSPTGAAAFVPILVQDSDGNLIVKTLTDERGEFRLTDLPAGRLRLTATASQGRAEATVELRPGDQEQLYLELR